LWEVDGGEREARLERTLADDGEAVMKMNLGEIHTLLENMAWDGGEA